MRTYAYCFRMKWSSSSFDLVTPTFTTLPPIVYAGLGARIQLLRANVADYNGSNLVHLIASWNRLATAIMDVMRLEEV